MTRRRDKKLMPEVLPAPTTARPSGSPRQRTLGHMNRLLAMAATGAVLGACEKPAPREQGSTIVNVPQPKETGSADDETPPPRDSASAPVAPDFESVPGEETTGYAVVDPMPPPARCAGLASTVTAKTKWQSATLLQVDLGAPSMANAAYVPSEAPQVWGGKLKKKSLSKSRVTLVIEIAPNSAGVSATVAVTCPAGAQHVSISITAPSGGPIAKGTPTSVYLGDAW
jgi:hypothetical protein